jgi:hypothetical protein
MKKKLMNAIFFFALCFFNSCEKSNSTLANAGFIEEIKGRDEEGKRLAVYRIRVPEEWIRHDPPPEESLVDTTKALCEFIIKDGNQHIRIAIHNFPSERMDQRIPPAAQVARWQRQLSSFDPTDSSTVSQVFNGFVGLLFTGVGQLNGENTKILGWSLQIANEHYRALSNPSTANAARYRQMRADVTIKAVGPRELMESHSQAITDFAQSFELIEEIPQSM